MMAKEEKKKKKNKFNPEKYIDLNPTLSEDELEDSFLDERAPLSIQQRRARGRTMRRYKGKMKNARRRAARRKASPEKLKARARKRAREIMRSRLSGGKKYNDMSLSQKVQLDKRLHRIPDATIDRIAKRQLPKVRAAERDRLSRVRGASKNEDLDMLFSNFLFERRIHPPKRYHQAFTKEGKVKTDRRFKFFRKDAEEINSDFLEKTKELMHTVESFVQNSDDPSRREQGTDSLRDILKNGTPGQNFESYFNSEIENTYGDFKLGSRVRFSSHSMDMGNSEINIEGTIVGTNTSFLRVRDDRGILYHVRHSNASEI